jgi:hypothetical protein
MAPAAVLERILTIADSDQPSAWADWETPAGGPPPLPRLKGVGFTCVSTDDPHLQGQSCLAIEPTRSDSETCLVAFACGCRARLARGVLRPL